jgi:hypothetical protein
MDDQGRPCAGYTHVRVFTTTQLGEHAELGDRLTAWIAREGLEVVAVEAAQSSDSRRHCVSLVAFARLLT